MFKAYSGYLLIVPVVILIVVLTQPDSSSSQITPAQSERFYTCAPGYDLEVRHQAVRCIRYSQESFIEALPCGGGAAARLIDYDFTVDACAGPKPQSIRCPAGTEAYAQPGNDLCVARLAGDIAVPSVKTER